MVLCHWLYSVDLSNIFEQFILTLYCDTIVHDVERDQCSQTYITSAIFFMRRFQARSQPSSGIRWFLFATIVLFCSLFYQKSWTIVCSFVLLHMHICCQPRSLYLKLHDFRVCALLNGIR